MPFPLFFRGLLGILLVVATSSYIISGSVWTTFVQTVIWAVLVQIGYFATVLFLVWWLARASAKRSKATQNL